MNDIALSIIYILAFLVELISASYILIANRKAPANIAIAALFTIFAFNSLALSALTGIFSLGDALPWIVVLVGTTFMIGPSVYLASVAVLRPNWLRHRWLYFPFFFLPVFSTLLVLSDATGLTALFAQGPFVFIPPSAETYTGGVPLLGDVTTGPVAGVLRMLQTILPALAMICPMLVVAIKDRDVRAAPGNSRIAWMLLAATAIAGASQVFLSETLSVSLTSIIAHLAYIFVFGVAALVGPKYSWSLASLRRALSDWPVFAKLVLVVVTVFIPSILVITSVSGTIVRQNMTGQIGTSFNTLARLQARGIADALRTQVDDLGVLSGSPVLLATLNLRSQQTSGMDAAGLRAWLNGEELDWVLSDLSMAEQLPADFSSSLAILSEFRESAADFTYLQVTDANGGLVSATETPSHFDFSNAGWWRTAYADGAGRTHISVPLRDPTTGSRYVQIAVPIYASNRITVVGILMGHFAMDDLIASLAATQVGIAGRTHLFSPNGVLITLSPETTPVTAQTDNAIELDWEDLLASPVPWRILPYNRVSSIVSWTTVGSALPDSPVETIFWRITVYQPVSEALAGVSTAQRASLVTAVLTAAVAFGFTWLFAGFITQPISSLTAVAERVLEGDLDVRAEMTGTDEVGVLASTFNTMTGRLRDLVANLESQVRSRTADLESQTHKLQAASQVGQGVISILDPDELIRTSVDAIRERFDLYYVGLFRTDEEGEWAVLEAGTGQAGAQMRARGHRIRIGEGMVGWSVRNGRARVAAEAAADIVRLTTPELPDTRSEAAIPIRARGQTIGALSVQSDRPNEFDPTTVSIFQSLADQLGIAIDNANLLRQNRTALQESREALETVRRTYQQMTRSAWSETVQQQNWELMATPAGVIPRADWPAAQAAANGTVDLDVPIQVRDVTVGTIRLRKPAGAGPWTSSETQYVTAYVNQLGSALDSARLFREIQDRSVQLQTSSEVGQAANAVLQLDELLPMAVQLIGDRFQLYYAGIFLVEQAGVAQAGEEGGPGWAVLRAGTGEAGRQQIEAGHRLEIGGQSMIGQAIVSGEPRIAMDVGTEAVRFDNPLLPETRTEIALPLIAGGEAIGAITIQSARPAAFTADEITVFQTMANQLGTAIQNARLFEQSQAATQSALEQRRIADALLKSSSRFTESPDREGVFRIVIEEIDEQIRPDQINIFVWDENRSAFSLVHRHTPGDPEDDTNVGDVLTAGQRPDLWQVYSELAPEYNPELRGDGLVHEQYRAPLMQANESIGVLETFHTARDAHIRPEDRAVINGILQQAAVALRSASSSRETQVALARTSALYQVGQAAIGMGSLPELLSAVAETIAGALPAEHVSIVTLDPETESVTQFVQNVAPGGAPQPTYKYLMHGLTGWVIRERKPALSAKGRLDPRDSTMMKIEDLAAGQRSLLVVPLIVRGEVLGTITASNGPEMPDFNEDDAELLQAMATQASVAIRNSELLAETQKTAHDERLLNEIGAQLIQSLDFETILRTAIEEIGQLPNISGVTLTLGETVTVGETVAFGETGFGDVESANGDEAH